MTTVRPAPSSTRVWDSPAATYYLFVVATAILLAFGLAVVLSSTSVPAIARQGGNAYSLFIVQAVALLLGLVAAAVGSRLSVRGWRTVAPWALMVAIALLLLVPFIGESWGGNTNWIRLGPVTVQPSELAKLALALYLGAVLAAMRTRLTSWKPIIVPSGVIVMVIIGLVMVGRDMGTAVIIALLAGAAYFVAGMPLRFFAVLGVLGALAVAIGLAAQPSRTRRITTWLAEECDPLANCMQSMHSTYALASGGIWGLGPGTSREKWGYLPAADNDFIFAILGEEFGLVGTLLVVSAFVMIVIAVNRIVRRHQDPFVQITAAALGTWLVAQAAVNMAVVVGLAPVAGWPLPFVSSGGSSLVASLAAMGVLMAFARHEPGAQQAFGMRPSLMRRSMAVMTRRRHG